SEAEGSTGTSQEVSGQNLSTDDIKIVDWWVFYTGPAEEKLIGSGTDTIAYPTTAGSLGGRIIGQVLKDSGQTFSARDQDEHVCFRYSVRMRLERHEKQYD